MRDGWLHVHVQRRVKTPTHWTVPRAPSSLERRVFRITLQARGGFQTTKSAYSALALDSSQHREVRKELELKKIQWLRRLTPIELERLNMFPDNHTLSATDAKRAFFMGNALVVGIVERLASELSNRMEGFDGGLHVAAMKKSHGKPTNVPIVVWRHRLSDDGMLSRTNQASMN